MPHKVNPISFEGAEANLLLSSNNIYLFNREQSSNRMQRDVIDKYVSREIGVSLVQAYLGYTMMLGGIELISFNKAIADRELDNHWEILSEGVQTILRIEGFEESYEKMKDLTRGKNLAQKEYMELIDSLDHVSDDVRSKLKKLTPRKYIGWALDIDS
jgi:adenylosuccinate lyase